VNSVTSTAAPLWPLHLCYYVLSVWLCVCVICHVSCLTSMCPLMLMLFHRIDCICLLARKCVVVFLIVLSIFCAFLVCAVYFILWKLQMTTLRCRDFVLHHMRNIYEKNFIQELQKCFILFRLYCQLTYLSFPLVLKFLNFFSMSLDKVRVFGLKILQC